MTGRAVFALTALALGAFEVASLEHVVDYEALLERDAHRVEMITALTLRRAELPADAVVGVFMAGTVPYFNPEHAPTTCSASRIAASRSTRRATPCRVTTAGTTLTRSPRCTRICSSPRRSQARSSAEEETFGPRDGYNMDLFDKRAFQEHYARIDCVSGGRRARRAVAEMYGRDNQSGRAPVFGGARGLRGGLRHCAKGVSWRFRAALPAPRSRSDHPARRPGRSGRRPCRRDSPGISRSSKRSPAALPG